MASALVDDLVAANRILFHYEVLDGFGHVSARDPERPDTFLLARYVAPGLVTADDVRALTLDGAPVEDRGERHYSERYIHGEIYKRRPDVMAVVHSHALPLLPFGVTETRLRPLYHMSAFLRQGAPVFEIRDAAGMTDMLIRTRTLGAALAASLGDHAVVLMRGHGATIVGASLRQAVYRAMYATQNASAQLEAMKLGEVTYLAPEEAELYEAHARDVLDRPWQIWKRAALNGTSSARSR